jgi:predicted PurR-regulated permease PerM
VSAAGESSPSLSLARAALASLVGAAAALSGLVAVAAWYGVVALLTFAPFSTALGGATVAGILLTILIQRLGKQRIDAVRTGLISLVLTLVILTIALGAEVWLTFGPGSGSPFG